MYAISSFFYVYIIVYLYNNSSIYINTPVVYIDLANKIGTYQLAITAHYHGVPFISAVTSSVVDVTMSSGSCIHIEERPASELTK